MKIKLIDEEYGEYEVLVEEGDELTIGFERKIRDSLTNTQVKIKCIPADRYKNTALMIEFPDKNTYKSEGLTFIIYDDRTSKNKIHIDYPDTSIELHKI